MMLQPLPEEPVKASLRLLLDYLSNGANVTPNNMLEGMVSGKSLLRGILSGNLIVCEQASPEKADGGEQE